MTGAEAVQPKLFRVDGFRNPTLSAERRRGLEATEALPLDMSVGGVLEAAEVRTLLEDFGPRDFEDRLGRLLAEATIAHARQANYSRLLLDTLASMDAVQRLYALLGFRPTVPYNFNPLPGTIYLKLDL